MHTYSQTYHCKGLEEIKQASIITYPQKRHSRKEKKTFKQMFVKAKQMFGADFILTHTQALFLMDGVYRNSPGWGSVSIPTATAAQVVSLQ